MKDGIINVYKPAGMTSNDVIYKMRSILGIKKLGHTGTLDPLATGVLPVCINRGTRVIEYMDTDFKKYRCSMLLGFETDTLDITGEVTKVNGSEEFSKHEAGRCKSDRDYLKSICLEKEIDEQKIIKAAQKQNGLICQMPPMASAVRINGRRLYDYMRKGSEEEILSVMDKIKLRPIFIKSIEIEKIDLPEITFSVECSKGTYIRSICRDIGDMLGTGGTLKTLERTASGVFTRDNAVKLEELIDLAVNAGLVSYNEDEPVTADGIPRLHSLRRYSEDIPSELEKYVLPVDFPMSQFGSATVDSEIARRFIDGWHIGYNECKISERPSYEMPLKEKELNDALERCGIRDVGSFPGIKLHPEYKETYRIYRDDGAFIGTARHSSKYRKLVCDKVFYRNDNI